MPTFVNLPKPGMGTEEGTLLRWLKSVGDKVEQGETIAEVEFAKAMQEIESPVSGTLIKILLPEGETARVNSDIAVIE